MHFLKGKLRGGIDAHAAPYLLAAIAVLFAALVSYLLQPVLEGNSLLLLFTLPVVIGALSGGMGAALLATLLSLLIGSFSLIAPIFSFRVVESVDQFQLLVFLAICVAIAFLGERLKRSQKTLQESDERFRLLVQGAQDTAIFFVSREGLVQSWNQGAARLKGYSAAEALGQPVSLFHTKESQAAGEPLSLLEKAERHGFIRTEGWRVRKDGSLFWADVAVTALHDESGRIRGFASITRDRSKEHQLLISLTESEQTSRALLESATQAVIGIGKEGTIRIANKASEHIFGYQLKELIGKPLETLIPEEVRSRHASHVGAFFTKAEARPIGQGLELKARRKNGEIFPIEASLSMTETPAGPLAVSFISDISKRKAIEAELLRERSQLKSILDHSPVLVSIRDLDGKFILANRSFLETLDMPEDKVLKHHVNDVYPQEVANDVWNSDRDALNSKLPIELEKKLRYKNEELRIYRTIKFPVSDLGADQPFGICSFSVDITEQKKAEEKVLHAARHDPLTGLPNRALIYEIGNHLIGTARRNKTKLAVLFFDLDRFKPINDTYGHNTGDKMLQEVARRLSSRVRSSDLVGRLAGDEFIAILTNIESELDVAHAAENLLHALSQVYHIDSLELRTSPSIGISMYPNDGTDIDALIRHADAAMYHAKGRGRNTYQFFTQEINTNTERAFALEQKLRRSIDDNDFELLYQPVIDTHTMHVVAVEALIRWRQKDDPSLMPGAFIAAAETSGLINQLGAWIFHEACQQHQAWRKQGLPPIRIAVNVSPVQFRSTDFQRHIGDALAQSNIDPACLELEVTEGTVMKQVEQAAKTLAELKDLGLRIALDDFGTGYSSLSYLSQFPIDKLKVDQSFIRHIDSDSRSLAIAETVIALGKKLGVEVVAEGIESQQALDLLRERGCDLGQGYLISAPMRPEHFVDWYRKTDPRQLYH